MRYKCLNCSLVPRQVRLVEGPFEDATDAPSNPSDVRHPVDLHLDWVLGKMPKKVGLEERCLCRFLNILSLFLLLILYVFFFFSLPPLLFIFFILRLSFVHRSFTHRISPKSFFICSSSAFQTNPPPSPRTKYYIPFVIHLSIINEFQVFHWTKERTQPPPLNLGDTVEVREALERVLRLPAVASKRYLTNKVSVATLLSFRNAWLECERWKGKPVVDKLLIIVFLR